MKGRTDEEGDDPVMDKPADNASVRGRCGKATGIGGRHPGQGGVSTPQAWLSDRPSKPPHR